MSIEDARLQCPPTRRRELRQAFRQPVERRRFLVGLWICLSAVARRCLGVSAIGLPSDYG